MRKKPNRLRRRNTEALPAEEQPEDTPAEEVPGEVPANHGLPPEEPTLADDKMTGAVDPETGEPRICDGKAAFITGDPSDHSPEDVGAAIIKGLDHLALCMTPEVRSRQPELFQVFQLYAAERPSILERQKRLQLRRNQG